jgi:uncharacterized protein (TIGR03086 family)
VDERELFVLADRALDAVVQRVRDDQWSVRMPADFQTSLQDAEPPTLREVLGYHAYDDAWVPVTLAGQPLESGEGPALDDDLLGDDPRAAFSALVERACAAVEAADDLERTVHLSYGDFPAREYLQHVTTFRALRAHDVPVALGAAPELPDRLVEGMWAMVAPQAEAWRAMGVFGPAVPVPDDAPLLDRLLGVTGRTPRAS